MPLNSRLLGLPEKHVTSGPMGYRGILGAWSSVGLGPLEVGKNLDRPVSERMEPNIYMRDRNNSDNCLFRLPE